MEMKFLVQLEEPTVKKAVESANLITISIGGNDLLYPAYARLEDYIFSPESALANMTLDCINTLNNTLATDAYPTSYNNLFKKLTSLSPNAKVCFTTQYNPYKYLWVEEGENGFFKPLFDTIPDNLGLMGELLKVFIKESFFGMELVKNFFNRINGLDMWVENLVNELNRTLKLKLGEFNNPNFFVAETKALYDSVPDRQGAGEVHYTDLVHVKYTRGYNFGDIHWGKLWDNTLITDKNGNVLSSTVCSSGYDFWYTLVNIYWTGSSIDTTGLIETLLYMVATTIVIPDLDLHPKEDGYYLLMRSFADTLRNNVSTLSALPALKTITYNAGNNGTGAMEIQKVLDSSYDKKIYSITKLNLFSPIAGHHFAAWKDDTGNSYSNGASIHVSADTTLYAQWDKNVHTLTVIQRNRRSSLDVNSQFTVAEENLELRGLSISGAGVGLSETIPYNNGDESVRNTISVKYGEPVEFWAKCKTGTLYKEANCNLYINNSAISASTNIYNSFYMPDNDATIYFDYCSDATDNVFNPWFKVWWDIYVFY